MDEPIKSRIKNKQYQVLLRCSEKRDITEWNEWRDENPNLEINLKRVYLFNAYLDYANLKEAHLEHASLFGAHLEHANLKGAHLEHADLEDVHLEYGDLSPVHLELVTILKAHEIEDISPVHLEYSHLQGAHLEHANLQGVHLEHAYLKGVHLENSCLREAHLEEAYLSNAYLEHADLQQAHLAFAHLYNAHLEHADLHEAYLGLANLKEAHLEDANLTNAHLEHAIFCLASINGNTLITECSINGKTDFRDVGLDNARIDSDIKGLLQYNIRRMNWEDWYKKHKYLQYPFKWFFEISDYGISTTSILWVFFGCTIFFSLMYESFGIFHYPGFIYNLYDAFPATIPYWKLVLRPLYFSIVTMTTLGFGDMHANPNSMWGHILLSLQVMLGYVLLGAIVTRLGILFTAEGPIDKSKFTGYQGNFLERFFMKVRNMIQKEGG